MREAGTEFPRAGLSRDPVTRTQVTVNEHAATVDEPCRALFMNFTLVAPEA